MQLPEQKGTQDLSCPLPGLLSHDCQLRHFIVILIPAFDPAGLWKQTTTENTLLPFYATPPPNKTHTAL